MHGHCTCGEIAFEVTDSFLCVHSCHCTWCQRETGSAFALNGLIETRNLHLVRGSPVEVTLASASGKGQIVARCPGCQVALWSHYAGGGRRFAFVRVGTLDEAARVVPDVFIFTSTALPWVRFPDGARIFDEFYRRSEVWSPPALARRAAEMAREA